MRNTKADVMFKEFWRVNERFADLFNTVIFNGKDVIKPESLQEMDTDVSGSISTKDYQETLSRTRDIIKKSAYGVEFVVVGIESQKHIHYAMPLRHMIYDALGYLKEYKEITRSHKNDGVKETEDEFLSKMREGDRLHPIVTLTIYYGEKNWNGPYCLKDMIVDMPEEIANVFSDYKMNLLEVRNSGTYAFNNEDVQTVFEITREAFAGHFNVIREKYRNKKLTSELLSVIGTMVGSKEIVNMSNNKEVEDMCTALEKLKQEGVKEGIEKERFDRILAMLSKGYATPEISEIFGISEEEVLKIKECK